MPISLGFNDFYIDKIIVGSTDVSCLESSFEHL